MTARRKITLALVGYSLGFWLTFGWNYNRPGPCDWPAVQGACRMEHEVGSVIAGLLWPGHWAGRLAIEVTKP